MLCRLLSVAFLLLVLSPLQVEGTNFKYNDDMACDSPVDISIDEMTCDDVEACNFGDMLSVSGSLVLENDLSGSTFDVSTRACFAGLSFLCKTYEVRMDLCSDLGLESVEDATCPSASSYNVNSSLKLPGQGSLQLGSGK